MAAERSVSAATPRSTSASRSSACARTATTSCARSSRRSTCTTTSSCGPRPRGVTVTLRPPARPDATGPTSPSRAAEALRRYARRRRRGRDRDPEADPGGRGARGRVEQRRGGAARARPAVAAGPRARTASTAWPAGWGPTCPISSSGGPPWAWPGGTRSTRCAGSSGPTSCWWTRGCPSRPPRVFARVDARLTPRENSNSIFTLYRGSWREPAAFRFLRQRPRGGGPGGGARPARAGRGASGPSPGGGSAAGGPLRERVELLRAVRRRAPGRRARAALGGAGLPGPRRPNADPRAVPRGLGSRRGVAEGAVEGTRGADNMEITDVKVIPVDDEKLKAFVSIVFDHCFVVTDIKVIHGPKGLFVSMPSKKRKDGTFKDIAHPLNNQMRQYLEEKVLGVYKQQVGRRGARARRRRLHGVRRRRRAAGAARPPQQGGLRGVADPHALGRGQVVRRGALDPGSKVRILPPQPPRAASTSGPVMRQRAEDLHRQRAPRAGRGDRPLPGGAARPRPPRALQRRRGLVPDPRQRPRRRRLRGPAHLRRRSTRT